ncbi:MAG: DUF4179 domain-containing protein [Oscillibacter sp.]|nr:DUF4179 domain-containing protein [Oscillibacter sp.]
MNRETYRDAFDSLSFSAGFQERTADLLCQRARKLEKERMEMNLNKTKKLAILAAACVALLVVSVSAAVLLLSPAEVAELHDQPLLAEAFKRDGAILLNETVESGDYAITLLGLVSGENLDVLNQDLDAAHTYSVLALQRLDGTPLETQTFDLVRYTMTPLVAGYAPTAVNNWTLNAGAHGCAKDGVYYYLLDTASIEMFADHTVYMAFYEGGAPSSSIFTVADDGTIAFAEDFDAVQALFTLPLDASKADPAAADAFVESTGLNNWSNEHSGGFDASLQENGDDSQMLLITPAGEEGLTNPPFTAEQFEVYLRSERERLQAEVENGALSQELCDQTIQELEDVLAGIRNGFVVAVLLDDGSLFVGTASEDAQADYQQTETNILATIH